MWRWRGRKGTDGGQREVGGRHRAKNAGRCGLLFIERGPEHLPSSMACVRDRRVDNEVTVLVGGSSFHPSPQALAGFAACSLGS